jgi:hypothetical protein
MAKAKLQTVEVTQEELASAALRRQIRFWIIAAILLALLLYPLWVEAGDQPLQLRQIFGQLGDKIGELRGEQRDEDDEPERKHDEESDKDHGRGHHARKAYALQAIGDRI